MSYEAARRAEKEGKYDEAALAYAIHGFTKLATINFKTGLQMRIAVGHLLESVSCDVRAGNQNRAKHIFEYARLHLDEIRSNTEHPVLTGLTHEWAGDGLLYLGDRDAISCYQTARDYFVDLSWTDERWKDEPDFMHFYWAFEGFIEGQEGLSNPELLELTFTDRLDKKARLADTIFGKGRNN